MVLAMYSGEHEQGSRSEASGNANDVGFELTAVVSKFESQEAITDLYDDFISFVEFLGLRFAGGIPHPFDRFTGIILGTMDHQIDFFWQGLAVMNWLNTHEKVVEAHVRKIPDAHYDPESDEISPTIWKKMIGLIEADQPALLITLPTRRCRDLRTGCSRD